MTEPTPTARTFHNVFLLRFDADGQCSEFTVHAGEGAMIQTTTNALDGRTVSEYLGVVTGEAILGANIVRDLFAGVRDIVGGRSGAYEEELRRAREIALQEMEAEAAARGADAVIGIDLDYETVGGQGSMLMVSASGTAVRLGA